MAYTRSNAGHGSWYQEYKSMINTASPVELSALTDNFDSHYEDTVNTLERKYGINAMRDAKKMMDSPEFMAEYKSLLLDDLLDEFRNYPTDSEAERIHLESVADQLSQAWDESAKSFFLQESYNTSTYLPLSTMDFPALLKQYIKFIGKDIIPVQTAASTNIEQRIFTKWLVNNQTGEEFETPAIYFKRDADGNKVWKKLFNAGKGYRFNNKTPILLSDIANATNKKLDLLQADYLLNENDEVPTDFVKTPRTRLSYDFNIKFVQATVPADEDIYTLLTATEAPADWTTASNKYYSLGEDGEYTAVTGSTTAYEANKYYEKTAAGEDVSVKVKLPMGGISVDIQTGGTFLNGGITEDKPLPVVDPVTNMPTGKTVTLSDRLSGIVDFVKGTVNASSCGTITGFYLDGYISNETNLRTIGFREYPEIRKFTIADGVRFQLPFTVEDFAEANASLNFNLYNRLVQELVTAQEMFEDESILEYLDREFDENSNYEADAMNYESYTHTEFADIDPTSISKNFAGNPYAYRTDAIQNAMATTIYELCDKGKLDNLGFVIYCNPKCARLLKGFVTWTVQKSTEIGGVQMNHAFGVMTDTDVPIRVVASNRIDAYTAIPAYQDDIENTLGAMSREYFYNIVAYPMDKFHISFKHLRFARHLTNSPENAAYADAQNPGGAAVYVTTSSQYKTITVQGIQGRVILKNTKLVPDSNAGLIV